MSRVELAISCFKEGFSCAQALLSTYGIQFGLSRKIALKMASAFGGGMGRMGETCGAVTGALMVLGLKYGRTKAEDRASQKKTDGLGKEFVDKFKSRNESILCKELLCCDISTVEGMITAKEKHLFTTVCPKLVQDAAEILEEILKE